MIPQSNRLACVAGLDTPLRRAHFMAQLAHESAGFTRLVENLNYSADGLRRTWPSRFTAAQALQYGRRPEAIANRVYGNRLGNGGEATGDGWRYRGRGYLQLTGRANYREFGQRLGVDLEANPDRAAEPEIAMRIAESYWLHKGLHLLADMDDLEGITRRINGGLNGLDDRRRWLAKFKTEYGA